MYTRRRCGRDDSSGNVPIEIAISVATYKRAPAKQLIRQPIYVAYAAYVTYKHVPA